MNAGLGNLDSLKRHLLAGVTGNDTRFDARLRDIGLGMAGMIEQYCNRQFARMAGDVVTYQADRASFMLPRYPVEAITKVEAKALDTDGWVAQASDFIESTSLGSGLVYLPDPADAGPYWTEVRFTYTGGYWWETLEPDDAGYPSAQPSGSKALPPDLKLAWLLQCGELWNKVDKLGYGLVDEPDKATKAASLDLTPLVKRMLSNYVQMQPI